MSRLLVLLLTVIFCQLPYLLAAQAPSAKDMRADEASIRALRDESNRAIQARDLAAFGQTMLSNIEVTRGSGSHVSGRDSVLASVSVQFKDPAFMGYVRTAERVQVSKSGPLAAEHGHWTGRFKRLDGVQTITGTYLAMWRKTDAGWKIRSELFVSLGCTGSAERGK